MWPLHTANFFIDYNLYEKKTKIVPITRNVLQSQFSLFKEKKIADKL